MASRPTLRLDSRQVGRNQHPSATCSRKISKWSLNFKFSPLPVENSIWGLWPLPLARYSTSLVRWIFLLCSPQSNKRIKGYKTEQATVSRWKYFKAASLGPGVCRQKTRTVLPTAGWGRIDLRRRPLSLAPSGECNEINQPLAQCAAKQPKDAQATLLTFQFS